MSLKNETPLEAFFSGGNDEGGYFRISYIMGNWSVLKMKKMIFLIFIPILFLCFCIWYNTSMESGGDLDISKIEGVYIYSDWYGDISAYQGEEIEIQLPVYDFSHELEATSMNMNNFDIGEIKNIQLIKAQTFPNFDQYLLKFVLVPQKVGLYEWKDLTISIRTKSNKLYTEKLGYAIFDVVAKQNFPLEIREGSGLITGVAFHFSNTILNKSSNKIDLFVIGV